MTAMTPSQRVRIAKLANYLVWDLGWSDVTATAEAEAQVLGVDEVAPQHDIDARCQPVKARPEGYR